LLYDNALTHKVAFANFWLTKMLQPFPDLSTPDNFLFPKLKMKLKGLNFADVAEIQDAVTDALTFWRLTSTIVVVPHR